MYIVDTKSNAVDGGQDSTPGVPVRASDLVSGVEGRRVAVFWLGASEWAEGVVCGWKRSSLTVRYDEDGGTEELNVAHEKVVWIDQDSEPAMDSASSRGKRSTRAARDTPAAMSTQPRSKKASSASDASSALKPKAASDKAMKPKTASDKTTTPKTAKQSADTKPSTEAKQIADPAQLGTRVIAWDLDGLVSGRRVAVRWSQPDGGVKWQEGIAQHASARRHELQIKFDGAMAAVNVDEEHVVWVQEDLRAAEGRAGRKAQVRTTQPRSSTPQTDLSVIPPGPAVKQAELAADVIGRRVAVFFLNNKRNRQRKGRWYEGVVEHADQVSGSLRLRYDEDESVEEIKIKDEQVVWMFYETAPMADECNEATEVAAGDKAGKRGGMVTSSSVSFHKDERNTAASKRATHHTADNEAACAPSNSKPDPTLSESVPDSDVAAAVKGEHSIQLSRPSAAERQVPDGAPGELVCDERLTSCENGDRVAVFWLDTEADATGAWYEGVVEAVDTSCSAMRIRYAEDNSVEDVNIREEFVVLVDNGHDTPSLDADSAKAADQRPAARNKIWCCA